MANPGTARSLDHGPTVIDVSRSATGSRIKKARIISMEGRYVFMNQADQEFFSQSEHDNTHKFLLAVDLGLRTGYSLFRDDGKLMHYEQLEFPSTNALTMGAKDILDTWEDKLSAAITRIAIEGSDLALLEVWNSVARGRKMLIVQPDHWREDLLSANEMVSGEAAKSASLRKAQEVVERLGDSSHKADLETVRIIIIMVISHTSSSPIVCCIFLCIHLANTTL
jgi:hypothetical protein